MRDRNTRKIRLMFFVSVMCLVFAWPGCSHSNNHVPHYSIAIIRTSPPYAIAIEKSLKKHLARLGYKEGKNVTFLPTITVKAKVENFSDTAKSLKEVLTKKPDIIATIGTQASVPAWPVAAKTDTPMVFSGVTYPINGGLIDEFNKPTGKNITGISYAIPTRQRVELIRKMFPDREHYKKIAFIYSGQVLQDFTYVKELKSLQGVVGWEFVFIDYFDYAQNSPSKKMLIQKLRQSNPDLAFGWYSLNSLATRSDEFRNFITDFAKPVLSITSDMNSAGAIGGFLTNHDNLGKTQAIMIDRILKGTFAGDIPPVEPDDYVLELNIKRARELGVTFDPELVKSASKLYN